MDTKIQKAIKKAIEEVDKVKIDDLELRKIAFSKAIDFYLRSDEASPPIEKSLTKDDNVRSSFWQNLANSAKVEEAKLRDIFSLKGEQVVLVIPALPGESKADKQRNLAALILFAYSEGLRTEWVSSPLLAEAAKHSKLYDTSKFAKNLKHDWFRSEGVKKGLKYKLSGPGLGHSKELIKSISE